MIPKKNTSEDLWRPRKRIEVMYQKALKSMIQEIESKISNIDNPTDMVRKIREMVNDQEFTRYADSMAMKMVTHLFSDAGHTWREAARENSKGRLIYEALRNELTGPIGGEVRHQIERNAAIIKTLPLDISRQVTQHVLRESLNGKRASDIAKEIKQYFPKSTRAKASLIARTEVSKTSTALTKSRCDIAGINWYVWRTSEDARVRSSHEHMEGVLISWNNAPSPERLNHQRFAGYYHAGEIYNCRCYPEPVISLDYIKWPHKVYYQGRIQTMSRKQFENIAA